MKEKILQTSDILTDNAHHLLKYTKKIRKKTYSSIKNNIPSSSVVFPALAQTDILRFLGKITDAAATKYDVAMDSIYNATNIGGNYHRLFDGGHDIFNAWQKTKEVAGDDSFYEHFIGYTSALWKDVTTVRGLPFTTVSKESFDTWVNKFSVIPGVNRQYLYDLLSFDALEVLSSTLGVISVLFCLKKNDTKRLAEILGSMGIVSIISANPLMGIMIITTTAYAYMFKKIECDKIAMFKSSISTVFCFSLFATLSFSLLTNLVLVCVLSRLFSNYVLDNTQLHEIISQHIPSKRKLIDIIPSQSEIYHLMHTNTKNISVSKSVSALKRRLNTALFDHASTKEISNKNQQKRMSVIHKHASKLQHKFLRKKDGVARGT